MQLVLTGYTTHSVAEYVDHVLTVMCVKKSKDTALMAAWQIIKNLYVKVSVILRVEMLMCRFITLYESYSVKVHKFWKKINKYNSKNQWKKSLFILLKKWTWKNHDKKKVLLRIPNICRLCSWILWSKLREHMWKM